MEAVHRLTQAVVLVAAACLSLGPPTRAAQDSRGVEFLGFTNLSEFSRAPGPNPAEQLLTSPIIHTRIRWDELIASWNATTPSNTWMSIEVCAFKGDQPTKYYNMGLWSPNPARHPRESVLQQKDEDGDVSTDTLTLKDRSDRLRIRVTLGGDQREEASLRFIGLCLTDRSASVAVLPANRNAWGKTLQVPELSQMSYPNGSVLCSPTTVSMLLGFWGQELRRPELKRDVPEIADAIYDANWKGTGNWSFNMAYAGSHPDLRAYVTRLTDVSELEDFIARGIPVGISLCYDLLRGRECKRNGHLVVCVGFTREGDVVVNDPGTSRNVRKVFTRERFKEAWAYSRNAVYIIHPLNAAMPEDRFGHWLSPPSQGRPTPQPGPAGSAP